MSETAEKDEETTTDPTPDQGSRLLSVMRLLENAKRTKRTGWLDCGVDKVECESIADHMFRMAVSAWIIQGDRAMKMAIVHDLCECIAGDIVPIESRSGVSRKRKNELELNAMREICEQKIQALNPSVSKEMMDLWLEFEEAKSDDARIVKDLDKLDMIITADHYERLYDEKRMHHTLQSMRTDDTSSSSSTVISVDHTSLEKKRIRTLSVMKSTDDDDSTISESSKFDASLNKADFLHQFFDSTRGIFKSEIAQQTDDLLYKQRQQRLLLLSQMDDIPTVHMIFVFGNDSELTSRMCERTEQWLADRFHGVSDISTLLVCSLDEFSQSQSDHSSTDITVDSKKQCGIQFMICNGIIKNDRDLMVVRQCILEWKHARILCAIKIDSVCDSSSERSFEETPLCVSSYFGRLFKFKRVPGVDPSLVWPKMQSILSTFLSP